MDLVEEKFSNFGCDNAPGQEKLQATVSLLCAGNCQAVFQTWFNKPEGWIA